jgi:hypothetical protein
MNNVSLRSAYPAGEAKCLTHDPFFFVLIYRNGRKMRSGRKMEKTGRKMRENGVCGRVQIIIGV